MEETLKKSLKLTAVLVLTACVILILCGRPLWAAGFLIGNIWSVANLLFTAGFFKAAFSKKNKTKLVLILMVKFPVLYLTGFLLLVSRVFPVSSLLSGLIPFVAITSIIKNVRSASADNSS